MDNSILEITNFFLKGQTVGMCARTAAPGLCCIRIKAVRQDVNRWVDVAGFQLNFYYRPEWWVHVLYFVDLCLF